MANTTTTAAPATTTNGCTVTVQGWAIPLVCPSATILASWGTPKLEAAATGPPVGGPGAGRSRP